MVRFLLLSILLTLLLRAFNRLWAGVMRGVQGERPYGGPARSGANVPRSSVRMERDPICGTFVVPERAVALATGGDHLYFCSAECRDKYRSSAASGSTTVHSRTA